MSNQSNLFQVNEKVQKGKATLTVDEHFVDQLKDRFGMNINVRDSFARAKQVNSQNALKFGKVIAERAYAKQRYEAHQSLFVNTYYDQVFVVDFALNVIVTTYKLSTAKPQYAC